MRRNPLAPRIRTRRRQGHVVMIHVGRSGSTVVGDLLGQHPRIGWDGEIYQRIFAEVERPDGSLPGIIEFDPIRFAVDAARHHPGAYYGFETKFFHMRWLGMDLPQYLGCIREEMRDLHVVVLERRNLLRMVVSTLNARATQVWHRRDAGPARAHPVTVDVDAVFVNRVAQPLVELLDELHADFAELGRLLVGRPHLWLTYEDDVAADPRRAYDRICSHIGLPAVPAHVRLVRTSPFPLPELILNYQDVAEALKGTAHEWMLEESAA